MNKDLMNHNANIIINSNPSLEDMNQTFDALRDIFIENINSLSSALNGFGTLKKKELELIEKRRVDSLIEEVKERLNNIDYNKISWNFFRTEEFARLVFDVYEKASKDYREDKLKYYANILVNYCTNDFSNDFYKEGIIERVSKYTIEHILILDEAYKIYMYGDKNGVLPQGTFKGTDIKIEKLSNEHLELCILDLKSNADLQEVSGFSYGIPQNNNFKISPYGIKCIEVISDYTDNK